MFTNKKQIKADIAIAERKLQKYVQLAVARCEVTGKTVYKWFPINAVKKTLGI